MFIEAGLLIIGDVRSRFADALARYFYMGIVIKWVVFASLAANPFRAM
jgi:hypothetical protein